MRFNVRDINMNCNRNGYSYNQWLEECLNELIPDGARLISLEKTTPEEYRIVYEVSHDKIGR